MRLHVLTVAVPFITTIWTLHKSITHGLIADTVSIITSKLITGLVTWFTNAGADTIFTGAGKSNNNIPLINIHLFQCKPQVSFSNKIKTF